MNHNRESVISQDGPIEIVQYRRRHSLVFEEGKPLETVKAYDQFEDIRLSDDLSQKGVEGPPPNYSDAMAKSGNENGVAPDGGYGWVIVFCSFCLNLIVDGITLTEGQLHTPLKEAAENTPNEFGDKEVSWVNGCLTGVTLLVGPFASVLVDRFGFRATVITGTIIAALGILLSWATSPFIPNIYCLVIFYGIVGGIGFGLVFSPSVVIVTHYFESKRALATGIAVCGTGVGMLVVAPLGTFLIENLGWSGTIIVQAAVALLCVLFGVFLVQPPTVPPLKKFFSRNKAPPEPKRRPSVVLSVSTKIANNLRKFVPFFLSPTYMIIAVSGAITMLGFFSPFAFIPDRAGVGFSAEDNGRLCLQVLGVFNVLARIVCGFLSDRPWTNNLMMSNTALTICGLATFFTYLIESYWVLVAYCGLFGLCIGCFATLRSIVILEFIGLEKMNDGFGLSLTFMGIASLFSSPIAGYLIDLREQELGHLLLRNQTSDGLYYHNETADFLRHNNQTSDFLVDPLLLDQKYDLAFQMAGVFIASSAVLCYPLRYVAAWEKSWKSKK